MSEQTKTGFRPVYGEEQKINATGYNEGWVYFATDSGKIFLDAEGARTVMGGSGASLFYAKATSITENPEGTYTLPYASLEDITNDPKENDLIINIPNGSFYKVIECDESNGVECELIAISGNGSGGGSIGGGEGGGGATGSAVTLELIDSSFPTNFVYQQDSFVKFKSTATDDAMVTITVKVIGSSSQKSYTYTVLSGEEFDLNIGQLLFIGTNSITITAAGENSGNATKKYSNRNCIQLALDPSSSFNPLQVFKGACSFSCIPTGAGLEKSLKVYIDGLLAASEDIPATVSGRTFTIDIPQPEINGNPQHGAFNVEIKLSATINGVEMSTPSLNYELAWRNDTSTTPIIWIPNGYNQNIVNYDNVTINYMVYNPAAGATEVHFYKESIEEATSPLMIAYSSTKAINWDLTDYEVGTNNYTIKAGDTTKNFVLYVEEDTSRHMNIVSTGMALNLDTTGRSNQEAATSRETWEYTNISGITTAVKFKNFNWYNNGWILDENNKSCLRISNGASIEIPLGPLSILNSKLLATSYTFEFRFKVRNINEYATLIQRDTTNADATDTVAGYETTKGVFGKLYNTCGLCLGTQDAFLKASSSGVNARYKEDEIVNVSFVIENTTTYPLMYIYINGVMSGIKNYSLTESFEANTTSMIFNSDYCDVDLYRIRIYKTALSHSDILNNYLADEKNVVLYDMNQLTTKEGAVTLDYNAMLEYNKAHPSAPLLPYMVFRTVDNDDILPYVKGGTKAVSATFVNPYLDYLWDNDMIDGATYLTSCPSYECITLGTTDDSRILNVQGTSSQGYPIRNYKIKCGDTDGTWTYTNGPLEGQSLLDKIEYEGVTYNKWYMDSNIGESSFTLKADYMDSSRAHNGGLASYVKTLYSKHPLEDYGVKKNPALRTTVYGFPMAVFQQLKNGSYKFIGLYNYLLDKSCKNTFGFANKSDSFVLDYKEMAADKFDATKALELNEEGKYVKSTDTEPVEGKTYYAESRKTLNKVCECWEMADNQGTYCSFQSDDFDTTTDSYEPIVLSAATYESGKYYILNESNQYVICEDPYDTSANYYNRVTGPLEAMAHYEVRYHAKKDDIEGAMEGTGDWAGKTQAERNAYMAKQFKNLKAVCQWLVDTKDDMARFKTEFADHFDLEYCMVYFILTELLHLYDSRGKNMMLATWGPQKIGGSYIWYPIFYDMDTQLGINNSGVPSWDYYAEPTEGNQFSTSNSLLWNGLWEAFRQQILEKYRDMRSNGLDIAHLNGYYAFDPEVTKSYAMRGSRPEILVNYDEYFKYIDPTLNGYRNTSGDFIKDTGSYFYCLQGTRALQRYLYLRNRFNYLDSKWLGGSYAITAKQEFWGRVDGNQGANTSDRFVYDPTKTPGDHTTDANGTEYTYTDQWPIALDSTPTFEITPFLRQYVHAMFDDNLFTDTVQSDGKTPVALPLPEANMKQYQATPALTQQLIYIGGGEYISDLGDLSTHYLDEIHTATLKRVRSMKIGSDAEYTDANGKKTVYFNNMLNSNNLYLDDSAIANGAVNPYAKTLLNEVILNGLGALDGNIDLTGSEKLQIFRALRTKVSSVEFADGVQLHTLHLPQTYVSLNLIEPTALTNIIDSPRDEDGELREGLYIEGLTNLVGTTIAPGTETMIETFNIVGGSLGYDSYKLLDTIVKIKLMMQAASSTSAGTSLNTYINLDDVDWTPYEKIGFGDPYLAAKTYFIDNGRYELEPYVFADQETWETDTLNGRVYSYDTNFVGSADENTVTDLHVLDTFITSYEAAVAYYNSHNGSKYLNYFRSSDGQTDAVTIPGLTGFIYVNNDTAIKEADLFNKYNKYFPELTIFCKTVEKGYLASFVNVSDGKETVIDTQRYAMDSAVTHPSISDKIPTKLNYQFKGWSLTENGSVLTESDFEALPFDGDHTSYKFYAVYEVTAYKIKFYNADGTTLLHEEEVNYGVFLKNPTILPSTDESSLNATQRYKFCGWVTDPVNSYQKTATTAAKVVVDLTKIMSQTDDRSFYACYYIEDCTMVPTPDEYFTFTPYSYIDAVDTKYNVNSGFMIAPATGYQLSGKITLPSTHNGAPVVRVAGFADQTSLTHVYWYGDPAQCRRIENDAFKGCGKLQYFQFPENTRYIGSSAFTNCSSLEIFDFSENNTLYYIGNFALNGAFAAGSCPLFVIPGSVIALGSMALAYNGNISGGIQTLQIGSAGHGTQLADIGTNAVTQNRGTKVGNLRIYADGGVLPSVLQTAIDTGNIEYTGSFETVSA